MNVWIVHQHAYTPEMSAGTRHYQLAKHLLKKDIHVTIIASSFYHKTRREFYLSEGEPFKKVYIDGIPFIWLRTPEYVASNVRRIWNNTVFAWKVFVRKGLKGEPKPDAIVGSSPQMFSALASYFLAKRYDVPFVLEVRDIWPQSLVDFGGYSNIHPFIIFLSWIERFLYRKSDVLITVMAKATDYYVSKGAPKDSIYYVPNGTDTEELLPAESHASCNSKYVFMYAGVHGLYNGLDRVIEAAEILKQKQYDAEIEIRLIGDGPHKPQLIQMCRQKHIDLIVFEDAVQKSTIPEKLSEADAFIMIWKDADVLEYLLSPNKLADYMAMGKPVVYAVPLRDNQVTRAKAGITVEDSSAAALAQAMIKLYELPKDEQDALGMNAREYAVQHFDMKQLAAGYEVALNDAVTSRKSLP